MTEWDQTEWDQTVGRAEDVRRVFEHVPTMLVAVAGPEYRVVANNAAHRAFAPRTVIGTSLREHFPELDGQSIFETFDQVVATGRSRTAHEWRVQADIDGTGVLREVFFDLLISPYLDRHGSVIGVQLAIDDVTDRVRARIAAETDSRRITESYQQVQQASLVMQRALLADAVPVLPGAEVAASYLVAAENTAAGGDWFDAMTEPGGCLVMVLGDVVGHGVRAAAVMAQLRTAVRMALFAGASIDSALGAVDRFSAEIPGAASATLCVARFDTETGIFEYCTAGHPPPLVITADGLAHYLDTTGAGPLGSGRGFATNTAELGIGDTVLLYSDGIIERPGVETHSSTDELAEVAARVRRGEAFPLDSRDPPLQRMCDDVIELLVRGAGYADDITLLSARRRTFPTPVHLEITADGTAERTARTAQCRAPGVRSRRIRGQHRRARLLRHPARHGHRRCRPRSTRPRTHLGPGLRALEDSGYQPQRRTGSRAAVRTTTADRHHRHPRWGRNDRHGKPPFDPPGPHCHRSPGDPRCAAVPGPAARVRRRHFRGSIRGGFRRRRHRGGGGAGANPVRTEPRGYRAAAR
ncbi:MAG: hypothetical protein FGM52_01485, partial [Mycobacterium sp.]|nr:hypothetical protein [Mycobacterium sp.]